MTFVASVFSASARLPAAMASAKKEVTCIPVYLEPHQRLGLTRCEVTPGVTLAKLSHGLRAKLEQSESLAQSFGANFSILVDVDKYAAGSKDLRRRGGADLIRAPWTFEQSELKTMDRERHHQNHCGFYCRLLNLILAVLLLSAPQIAQAGVISFQQPDNDVRDGLDRISTPNVLAVGQSVAKTFSGERIVTDVDGNKRVDAKVDGRVVLTNSADGTSGSLVVTDFFYRTTFGEGVQDLGGLKFVIFIDQIFEYRGGANIVAQDNLTGLFAFTDLSQSASLRVSAGVGPDAQAIVPALTASATSTTAVLVSNDERVPVGLSGGPSASPGGETAELSATLSVRLQNDGRNGLNPDFEMFSSRSQRLIVSYSVPSVATVFLLGGGVLTIAVLRLRRSS